MNINTEQSTCEKVTKLLYGTAKWIHDNDMHIESAIDIVLIFLFCLSHNRVFVHRAWRTSFMPCAVDILLWCDRKFPPKAIAIYHQIDVIVRNVLRADWTDVLWLNLSRVRVVESITTDCLAGWLAIWIHFLSFVLLLLIHRKINFLFLKFKTTTHSKHAVFNI